MTEIEKSEMLLAKARFPFLPWQFLYSFRENGFTKENWVTASDQSFDRLLQSIGVGDDPFRFDLSFIWPYPPETRDGVAVWVQVRYRSNAAFVWKFYLSKTLIDFGMGFTGRIVAADPRNLQEPPK
ncbi:MAG TPA: hypothetical protein VJ248_07240 [Candidatus Udaeobacter sp.]|nr:hypothetical protein [Candidatus Udaeobacter sp.]